MRWILRGMVLVIGAMGAGRLLAWRRRRMFRYTAPESYIVDPQQADGRYVALEGGVNFRDLGGYTTQDGRHVRRGLVYRTGTLNRLTAQDWQTVQALGLKLVCDLRSPEEVAAAPDQLPDAAIQYAHIPLQTENENWRLLQTVLLRPQGIQDILRDSYLRIMIDENPQVFGEVLRRFADPAHLPAIVHCTAGKDRTGVASALLLAVLGVPEDTIIADYTLSNHDFRHFHAYAERALEPVKWMHVTADDLHPLLVADAETMRAVFAHIRARYGSVEAYLEQCAGVDAEVITALRTLFLE